MKITLSQLRRMIVNEARRLQEAPARRPRSSSKIPSTPAVKGPPAPKSADELLELMERRMGFDSVYWYNKQDNRQATKNAFLPGLAYDFTIKIYRSQGGARWDCFTKPKSGVAPLAVRGDILSP